jgi:lipopolysaccharide transport system ATP-binding protein
MSAAIVVDSISKRYQIGAQSAAYSSLREAITESVKRFNPLKRGRDRSADSPREVWALRDVTFEVAAGEVVGIIGRNGAGKSTLLKVLSRIVEPTTGRAVIRGRVGSLLEVGTGFHPELTGRENIFLNGAILGMKRKEIARKFDEIVAFAEVEKFVDTPVKRFSSGMYMRLAFAVAAHLETEILVIDEVLAVGDVTFQRRSIGKIGEVARSGRTVLFVSHNMPAIQSLCSHTLWIHEGTIKRLGETQTVVREYLSAHTERTARVAWSEIEFFGTQRVALLSVEVSSDDILVSTDFAITIRYRIDEPVKLSVQLAVFNEDEVCVFTTSTLNEAAWQDREFERGLFQSVCRIPGYLLNEGLYSCRLTFYRDVIHHIAILEDVITFEVGDIASDRGGWFGKWVGIVRPSLNWTTERISET